MNKIFKKHFTNIARIEDTHFLKKSNKVRHALFTQLADETLVNTSSAQHILSSALANLAGRSYQLACVKAQHYQNVGSRIDSYSRRNLFSYRLPPLPKNLCKEEQAYDLVIVMNPSYRNNNFS